MLFRALNVLAIVSALAAVTFARVEKDVSYGSDPAQKLDLFTPSVKAFPIVIFIHGGSLSSGDKADSDYKDVCTPFDQEGIGCANINYRLGPANRWPAPGEDVALAVKWIQKNISSLGGNAKAIFLFGHSSGATLAALIGTNEKYLKNVGLKSDAISGVIPMGSIMWDNDLDQAIERVGRERVLQRFSGGKMYQMWGDLVTYQDYWPFHHIRGSMPPFLFLIAEGEQVNPPILMTNSKFVEKARSMGNTADFNVLPARTHYSAIRKFSEKNDPAFLLVSNFVRKNIGKK